MERSDLDMELISLHPFDQEVANRYIAALTGDAPPDPAWQAWWKPSLIDDLARIAEGREDASNRITLGLAWALAGEHPTFVRQGFGLTTWEARIDRGVGMLMRPPARIFVDAGVPRPAMQSIPIRLEVQAGMMGGAYVPPRLINDLGELLDSKLERMAKRMNDADYDPFAMIALLHQAVSYARERGLGLYEAQDAVGGPVPGMHVVEAPEKKRMDTDLRKRIETAIAEEKKGSLFSRFFGKKPK